MGKRAIRFIFGAVLAGAVFLSSAAVSPSQSSNPGLQPPPGPPSQFSPMPPLGQINSPNISPKQQRAMKKARLKDHYKKMKQDTDELVKLANKLQKSVSKSNSQILSVEVVETADKIEKLAKKIKSNAQGGY